MDISCNRTQICILPKQINVISSKLIYKFAQKCQYSTLMDQKVHSITVLSLVYFRRIQVWPYSKHHSGKKVGEVRIIPRTLRGLGFLLVASYIFLVDASKIFQSWNKQQPPINMHIIGSGCLFHLLNICVWQKKTVGC